MPKLILVASPHLAFGELLRLSLEESGKFRVRLARSTTEALNQASKTAFALLILDADLSDAPFSEFAREIKQHQAQARLILIPPENNPQHPSLQGLAADAYINKPFYQPDLIKTVEDVLALPNAPAVQAGTRDARVQPVNTPQPSTDCQRVLDQALVDGSVQAAWIHGGKQVQASDGRLSPAELQELAASLSRTPRNCRHGDQIRFVKLQQGNELLLFSTGLAEVGELALACDSSLPLSRVRTKAAALAREIRGLSASPPLNNEAPALSGRPTVQAAANINEDDLIFDDSELEAPDIRVQELLASAPLPPPFSTQPSGTSSDDNNWLPESVGAPVPKPPTSPLDQTTPNVRVPFPLDPPPMDAPTIPIRHRPVASDDPTQPVRLQKTDLPKNSARNNIQPPPSILPLANPAAAIAPDDLDLQSMLTAAQGNPMEIEPVSMTYSRLSYSALLMPRFPQHALVGKLSGELADWLPQLCVAYGWRLEGLAIRPDRLQFTFQAAPSISPGNVVRILRQQTSRRIFNRFPELKDLNPSGDFWAPGYLIISGSTPPPSNLLNDFVAQTRRRQGLAAV